MNIVVCSFAFCYTSFMKIKKAVITICIIVVGIVAIIILWSSSIADVWKYTLSGSIGAVAIGLIAYVCSAKKR